MIKKSTIVNKLNSYKNKLSTQKKNCLSKEEKLQNSTFKKLNAE
jgi:hypothetical protein